MPRWRRSTQPRWFRLVPNIPKIKPSWRGTSKSLCGMYASVTDGRVLPHWRRSIELFLALERLAVHPRSRHRIGRRIFIKAHFPPASKAYYEATPQNLLSQSRFIHPELNRLFVV